MTPTLIAFAVHLTACMPLGFARHDTVRRDCVVSRLIPPRGRVGPLGRPGGADMSADRRIPEDGLPPPTGHVGMKHWLRERLFSSPLNTLLTALAAWLLLMALPPLA